MIDGSEKCKIKTESQVWEVVCRERRKKKNERRDQDGRVR